MIISSDRPRAVARGYTAYTLSHQTADIIISTDCAGAMACCDPAVVAANEARDAVTDSSDIYGFQGQIGNRCSIRLLAQSNLVLPIGCATGRTISISHPLPA